MMYLNNIEQTRELDTICHVFLAHLYAYVNRKTNLLLINVILLPSEYLNLYFSKNVTRLKPLSHT